MTQLSVQHATREELRAELDAIMAKAISNFNAEEALDKIRQDFVHQAKEIAQELLGVDYKWSTPELASKGALRQHMSPIISKLLETELSAAVEIETRALLASKGIQTLIHNSIKREVKDHIHNLGGYKSIIRDRLTDLVDCEYNAAIDEWLASPTTK